MKIICDSCGTKYSISDDKVRGKVFKIRCKKCSHIIVVRGGEPADPRRRPRPRVEGGWHIVVDGEQVGPIARGGRPRPHRARRDQGRHLHLERGLRRLVEALRRAGVRGPGGRRRGRRPAWRRSVRGLGARLSRPTARSAPAAPSGAGRSLFGGGGGASDVFAAPAASARAAAAICSRLGGRTRRPPSESRWPSSGAAAAGHDGGRVESLTGQRHENSVLFSLSNLQSLAMSSAPSRGVDGAA